MRSRGRHPSAKTQLRMFRTFPSEQPPTGELAAPLGLPRLPRWRALAPALPRAALAAHSLPQSAAGSGHLASRRGSLPPRGSARPCARAPRAERGAGPPATHSVTGLEPKAIGVMPVFPRVPQKRLKPPRCTPTPPYSRRGPRADREEPAFPEPLPDWKTNHGRLIRPALRPSFSRRSGRGCRHSASWVERRSAAPCGPPPPGETPVPRPRSPPSLPPSRWRTGQPEQAPT